MPFVQVGTETLGVERFVVIAFQFIEVGTRIEPDKVRKELAELPDNG